MWPRAILTLNNQRHKTLVSEQGGIRPDWEDTSRIARNSLLK